MHRPAAGSSECPGHILILQRPLGRACDLLSPGQVPCGERCQPGRAWYPRCTCCLALLPGCLLRCLARAAPCMLLDVSARVCVFCLAQDSLPCSEPLKYNFAPTTALNKTARPFGASSPPNPRPGLVTKPVTYAPLAPACTPQHNGYVAVRPAPRGAGGARCPAPLRLACQAPGGGSGQRCPCRGPLMAGAEVAQQDCHVWGHAATRVLVPPVGTGQPVQSPAGHDVWQP